MLLREFFTKSLAEGGNVRIGDVGAERIDLKKIPRNQITPIIDKLLHSIDAAYRQKYKSPLWDPELLKSKEFLSGSAFHFLNVAIPDEKFVKVKPSVGDIDTMVDKNKKEPKAGRVFGPIPYEISKSGIEGYKKIASLAPEVI